MLQRSLVGLVLTLALGLTGCVHSPQQITPHPKLNETIAPVGQGQPVVVRVVDGRSSQVLGTRGGLYAETSSVIVPSATVLPKLQEQVEAGVRLLGFTPSPNAYNAPQMVVTLADLKYQSPKEGLYVTEADIAAILRVEIQSGGRTYNGRYGASLNQRFGMAPNEQTNTKLISDVLSDALTRMFRDASIGQALSR